MFNIIVQKIILMRRINKIMLNYVLTYRLKIKHKLKIIDEWY